MKEKHLKEIDKMKDKLIENDRRNELKFKKYETKCNLKIQELEEICTKDV